MSGRLAYSEKISRDAALEVRYVGNHGTRLFQTIDGNPYILGLANAYPNLVPAGLKPCPASQAAIPELVGRVNCTGGALVQERTNDGYSDYNGLQIEFRSRLSGTNSLCRAPTPSAKRPTTPAKSARLAPLAILRTFRKVRSTSRVRSTGSRGLISRTNSWFPRWKRYRFSGIADGLLGQVFGGWRAAAVYTLSSGQPYTAVQFATQLQRWRRYLCLSAKRHRTPTIPLSMRMYALPDGSLRPFLGSSNAPVQSVGIFAKDICASDSTGNLCGNSAIFRQR